MNTERVSRVVKAKRDLKLQSYYLGGGCLLSFSSFIGVVSLQSSVNIAQELGTTSLAVCYITNLICNATFTPSFLKYFGPKKSLVIADALYMLYTLANIYPSYPTVLPAAFFLGIAQAISWSDFPVFNGHFGMEYSKLAEIESESKSDENPRKNVKDPGAYVRRFTGKFFSITAGQLVIGNMTSYIILKLGTQTDDGMVGRNFSTLSSLEYMNTSSFAAATTYNVTVDYSTCGSNQCSDASISRNQTQYSDGHLDKYLIKSWTLQVILFTFYALLQVLCLLIHACLLKDPYCKNVRLTEQSTSNKHDSETVAITRSEPQTRKRDRNISIPQNVMALGRHLADPLQLCIVPMNVHFGFILSFIFGDLTRSYVSCISGVQQVGIMIAIMGVVEILASFVFARFGAIFGRKVFMIFSSVVEIGNILLCLLWIPSGQSLVPYLLVVGWAVSDGLRQPILHATVVEYFNHKGEVAYSTLPLLTALGTGAAYLSSRFLCVRMKLYIILATCMLSLAGFLVAERKFNYQRTNSSPSEGIEIDEM